MTRVCGHILKVVILRVACLLAGRFLGVRLRFIIFDNVSKIYGQRQSNQVQMSQGILVTAGKVHTPFKTELLNTIGGERFAARPPHLVGILATKKEDARTYAEVC